MIDREDFREIDGVGSAYDGRDTFWRDAAIVAVVIVALIGGLIAI